MCHEVEARANNCENKASLWTDFKNSFAWLTGMKKLIFDYNNFFGSSYFLTCFSDLKDQKRAGAKKGLPRLALPDSDKEDKSAHVKCYIYQKWTNESW